MSSDTPLLTQDEFFAALTVAPNASGDCPICYSAIDTSFTIPCNHDLCSKCFTTWLQTSHTCPLCRRELYQKPVEEDEDEDEDEIVVGASVDSLILGIEYHLELAELTSEEQEHPQCYYVVIDRVSDDNPHHWESDYVPLKHLVDKPGEARGHCINRLLDELDVFADSERWKWTIHSLRPPRLERLDRDWSEFERIVLAELEEPGAQYWIADSNLNSDSDEITWHPCEPSMGGPWDQQRKEMLFEFAEELLDMPGLLSDYHQVVHWDRFRQ